MSTKNFLYALPPFSSPYGVYVSEEQAELPALYALKDTRPGLPWRTVSTTQADFHLRMNSIVSHMFVNNVNYPEITLQKSTDDGVTWTELGPNFLKRSHQPDGTPWTQVAGVATSLGAYPSVAPPVSTWPSPTRISVGSGATWGQQVNFGTNIAGLSTTLSAWVRKVPGAGATPFALTIYSGTPFQNQGSTFVSLTDTWQYVSLTTVAQGSGTTQWFGMRGNPGPIEFLVSGCQWSYSPEPYTIYQTGDVGLIIPTDVRVGRRKCLIDLGGAGLVSGELLRYRIPASQSTTSNLDVYETGALTFIPTMQTLPGMHNFPYTLAIDKAVVSRKFSNGAEEFVVVGPRQASLTIRGQFVASQAEQALYQFLEPNLGRPIIFAENTRVPGVALTAYRDPSRAYMMTVNNNSTFEYAIPEVIETSITMKEIL